MRRRYSGVAAYSYQSHSTRTTPKILAVRQSVDRKQHMAADLQQGQKCKAL